MLQKVFVTRQAITLQQVITLNPIDFAALSIMGTQLRIYFRTTAHQTAKYLPNFNRPAEIVVLV